MSENKKNQLSQVMPGMMKHAGLWKGFYTHLDAEGGLIDQHQSTVECEFPETGPYAYIQHNQFVWEDGREARATLPGILKNGKLWWDTDTFKGCAWETDFGLVMLNLERKDDPGANFYEIIALGQDGRHRSRTWHWFKNGKLFKRTLCEEKRVGAMQNRGELTGEYTASS